MKTGIILPAAALIFLVLSVVSGTAVSRKASVNTFEHIEVLGSGLQRLKHFIASALYLQLDDYHHIAQFQGASWTEVTDYLPQMWLIAKLVPNSTDFYTDAAYHLAINLGSVEAGMDFIREGTANNPDSLDVRFEYAYLLWETGAGTPGEIIYETLAYRSLVRKSNGDVNHSYNEPSSSTLLAEVFEARADSLNPYSLFYRRRSFFVREAISQGVYYPDYLSPPPVYLNYEKMDGTQ